MPLTENSWCIPPAGRMSWMWKISSKMTVSMVGLCSKLWIEWLNTIKLHNKEALVDALENRPKGQGIITVSNHTSCIDDPLIWGVLKVRQLVSPNFMRWTSAAHDIVFEHSYIQSLFFSLGQVYPIVRGDGVYQKGMDFMIDRLDSGHWCHMFPEGKINMTHEFMRLKWGVGRAIAECKRTPLVLPVWHVGMDQVLPNKKPYIPQIRKKVTLLIGKPLEFSEDLKHFKALNKNPREIRKYFTDQIQEELQMLKEKAEALHEMTCS